MKLKRESCVTDPINETFLSFTSSYSRMIPIEISVNRHSAEAKDEDEDDEIQLNWI